MLLNTVSLVHNEQLVDAVEYTCCNLTVVEVIPD